MSSLILEPTGYSHKALSLYDSLGDVYLGLDRAKLNAVKTLIVRLNYKIDKKICDQLKNLQLVATPTTGLSHLDMDYLKARGVTVISLRDTPNQIRSISSTTEITIWHIINIVRQAASSVAAVTLRNEWRRDDYRLRQLSNMTLGIVGMGRIGSQVAHVCQAIGMNVCFYDPYLENSDRAKKITKYKEYEELNELLVSSDVVSIHVPLNAKTENLFCETTLLKMKPKSYLVNTSRGEIIDENATARLVVERHLSGYACDVLANEQSLSFATNELIKLSKLDDRIQITPHIGGCTVDAMHLTEEIIAEKVVEYFNAKPN